MELSGSVRQAFQKVAECAASCRVGQLALRQADRALWVLEKSARWAVPPPLDQDERPSQELVRPLPWLPFLLLLTVLRLVRESVSIFNLVIGKPPLHSADVVMFLQSKRRYLRALKYQGSRTIRAKRAEATQVSWLSRLTSLFEFTMCFRQRSKEEHSGNANNEEVLVVRRKQAKKEQAEDDSNVDRLIERMLVDLNTDSDDDSSYTLTNATSVKSCSGSDPDSENESTLTGGAPEDSAPSSVPSSPTAPSKAETKTSNDVSPLKTEPKPESASTPIKEGSANEVEPAPAADDPTAGAAEPEAVSAKREPSPSEPEMASVEREPSPSEPDMASVKRKSSPSKPEVTAAQTTSPSREPGTTPAKPKATPLQSEAAPAPAPPIGGAGASAACCSEIEDRFLNAGDKNEIQYTSLKQQTENFMVNERAPQRKVPKRTQKLANGKAILCAPSGKKGMSERRDSDVPVVRVTPAEDSAPEDEDYARKPHHNNH